jgi:hypothetical protein
MEFGEALAEAVRELHRTEQNSARTGQSMRQQIPLEAFIMLPNWSVRMPKEALVVVDDIRDHQPDDGKDDIFNSEMKHTSTNLDGCSCHGSPPAKF